MKACFLLQRRFAFLGHQMAIILKEKYGVKDFCGYVTTRPSFNFLKFQKDINYSQLILEEDIYAKYKQEKIDLDFLRSFEREYGIPNLWPYILSDRVLRYNLLVRAYPADEGKYSHEDLVKIFQVTARTIVKFLEEEKPDFVFFSVVSNLGSYLLYEIARKKGINTLLICDPRLGSRYTVSESYNRQTYVDKAIKCAKEDERSLDIGEFYEQAKSFLKNFQEKPVYYLKDSEAADIFSESVIRLSSHFRFLRPKNFWQSICWFFKSHYDYFLNKNHDKHDYSAIKPWWEAWDKLMRKLRMLKGYGGLYDSFDLKEDYAYFALHAEPEAILPFSSPFYTDQQWIIEQIARSLPLHYKLYVKDHPQMAGRRTISYYKQIKKIPNVKLIDPAVSSLKLSQNSRIVTTMAGTAGWEAVLLKKPVIIFGEIFYSPLSMVKMCTDITRLPHLVKEQLENFKYNEEELLCFLSALYKESVPLDLPQIWDVEGAGMVEKKKRALTPLVDLLAKKLALKLK